MKKIYNKPEIEVSQVAPVSVICASSNISIFSEPFEDDDNTFIPGLSGGDWGSTSNPD